MSFYRRIKLVLLVGCALLLSWPASRADEPDLAREIAQALEPIRKKHNLPALAGAIVTSRGLLATAAVGRRRADSDVPVSDDDLWHMGSCTKALTATTIATLVEQGKLSWDITIAQAFPEVAESLPPDLRQATLLQLLSHRAGLVSNLMWSSYPRDQPIEVQRDAALRNLADTKLVAKPGAKFEYSNTGYVLAAMMAERATKTSWEDLMRQRLFQPLAMRQATCRGLGTYDQLDRPWPHEADGRPCGYVGSWPKAAAGSPLEQAFKSFADGANRYVLTALLGEDGEAPVAGPAGATLRLSLEDWSKFVADQMRGDRGEPALLKPATYQTLHKPHFGGDYALGWGVRPPSAKNGPGLAHSGSNALNFSVVRIFPARGVAVLACTNQAVPTGESGTRNAADELLKLYDKHFPPANPAP